MLQDRKYREKDTFAKIFVPVIILNIFVVEHRNEIRNSDPCIINNYLKVIGEK
jgi:hypothetical protein